jgi:hypothetical protein
MIKFSPLNRKQVEANFEGGSITSNGGLLLLRETDKRLKLTARISKCITENRKSCLVQHDIKKLLRQRVYAISVGDEDVNDQDKLRDDICFQTCVDQESRVASSSTISRFENSIDRERLKQMSIQMVESFIDNQQTVPEELILDFDPTDNPIYGNQENRHYHGYYKNHCYLPLHIFCGDQLILSMLRPSDIDGAKYAGAILKLLVERFRETWADVRIIFRGDCGFARRHILHWCERNNVDYVVGMPSNVRLHGLAKTWVKKAEDKFKATGEKQKLFADFNYAAQSWKTKRRIVLKAEHNSNGANTRFVITSLSEYSEIIYSEKYCMRGNMENHIKQLKLDLHSDRNSCSKFYANYFRLLLSSLAYILITELKNTHLKTTKLAKAYCGIIQLKLFKIGAVVIKNSRRIKFLLSSAYTMQKDFITAVQSLVPS